MSEGIFANRSEPPRTGSRLAAFALLAVLKTILSLIGKLRQ